MAAKISAQLQYAQHMMHLCETQAAAWDRLGSQLAGFVPGTALVYDDPDGRPYTSPVSNTSDDSSAPRKDGPGSANADQGEQARHVAPAAGDPDRARLRMRLAHIIRGLILIFALGLPRLFYYLYGMYGVFVLSGALEKLQSPEFRRILSGSKPALDVQLARLRQRIEMLTKLEDIELAIENDEPFDVDEFRRINEYLQTFEPNQRSWSSRFTYQLVFMFVYSALPTCHPDPDFLK